MRQAFSVSAIALAMVVAGSGDLSVYRRLRLAHSQETNFGIRTAMHIAAGLVFLGAGRYSLGSSDTSVAALVIAFLPKFTAQPEDNRAYLQAYRHLWALAVEPRCFVTTDAHTLDKVYLPIKIKVKETRNSSEILSVQGISPTLLDTLDRVLSVTTQSPRYTTGTVDLTNREDRRRFASTQTLFVQRKAAFLDYFVDPKGYRTFQSFAAPFAVYGQDDAKDVPGWGSSLSLRPRDTQSLALSHATNLLTRAYAARLIRVSVGSERRGRFCVASAFERVLIESLMNDRQWLLPVHLAMLTSQRTTASATGTLHMQQYISARTFFDLTRRDLEKPFAIRNVLVQHVSLRAARVYVSLKTRTEYFAESGKGSTPSRAYAESPELAHHLIINKVPALTLLRDIYDHLIRNDSALVIGSSTSVRDSQAAVIRLILRDEEPGRPRLHSTGLNEATTVERDRASWKADARATVLHRLGHAETGWTCISDALHGWASHPMQRP